jgi:hypothetical protein
MKLTNLAAALSFLNGLPPFSPADMKLKDYNNNFIFCS